MKKKAAIAALVILPATLYFLSIDAGPEVNLDFDYAPDDTEGAPEPPQTNTSKAFINSSFNGSELYSDFSLRVKSFNRSDGGLSYTPVHTSFERDLSGMNGQPLLRYTRIDSTYDMELLFELSYTENGEKVFTRDIHRIYDNIDAGSSIQLRVDVQPIAYEGVEEEDDSGSDGDGEGGVDDPDSESGIGSGNIPAPSVEIYEVNS